MKRIYALIFIFLYFSGYSQNLDPSRSVDWTLAGLNDTTTSGFLQINMQDQGALGDGITPNDCIITNVLSSISNNGVILNFPSGDFLFNNTINLPSNVIIRGQGAESTTFTMDLGGSGHAINIQGSANNCDTSAIIETATKDYNFIIVLKPEIFSVGDWVQIIQNDSDLVTSSWAKNTVGQIAEITSISNNKIFLNSPLRIDFNTNRSPYILKINPVKNVGIECLKIHRLDNTAPSQTSNIYFYFATNCWVTGIESENCTFSHLQARRSSNLYISKSYFHHSFDYGSGGRGYGVMLHSTSNECLIENNIFEHLRHSMILQSGANGNVFTYNYSNDAFWSSFPYNAAGDIVLHGNYTFANLFEQNICQNIVIDDSHGPNGPYNTFFRNRAEICGIFFSAANSPNQNIIGNEITNTNLPYSAVNYNLQGTGHYLYGNNNKGTIHPEGTNTLTLLSYAYNDKPNFVPNNQWAGIGTPNIMGSASIPAYDRFHTDDIFRNACGNIYTIGIDYDVEENENIKIYPNPNFGDFNIKLDNSFDDLRIDLFAINGSMIKSDNFSHINQINYKINTAPGIYWIQLSVKDEVVGRYKVVKVR